MKKVDNFKYLGAWIDNTENDVKVRKALAWKSCNKLNKVWQSSLSKSVKLRTFLALVESVFLYGSETWTLTKSLEKSIDGTYTRLLRMAFNVSWSGHVTNSELCGNLPKVSEKIRQKTKIFWTLSETSRRDSILLDFMATITWKTEQRGEYVDNLHERYQHGKSGRTTISDAR